MKIKPETIKEIAAVLILLVIGVSLPILITYEKEYNIEIKNDKDFKKYKFPGNGSVSNPYLIENLSIIRAKKRGISISNTSKYFVIRNCTLGYNLFNGINIQYIKNGTAKIYDNVCFGHSAEGINIVSSDYLEVYNNTCFDNKIELNIESSKHCYVANNHLYRSREITGQERFVYSGLILKNSFFVTIDNNKITQTTRGIYIEKSYNCTISNNNINKVANLGVTLISSSYCNIIGTTSKSTIYDGFVFRHSNYNYITNCSSIVNNFGFYLSDSSENTLSFNKIERNREGLHLTSNSHNNTISYNEFLNNTDEGVNIDGGEFNIIHHNTFSFNNLGEISQAQDNSSNNIWYDINSHEGNFWNGWNSSDPYVIMGSANSTDLYPLDEPINLIMKNYFIRIHQELKSIEGFQKLFIHFSITNS